MLALMTLTFILARLIAVSEGLDDLWHFLILLCIILFGFMALGTTQFGGARFEFQNYWTLFETLWDMLLGNMPQSGPIPSSYWSNDYLMMIYILLYNFLCFMFMLNFIIAM